MQGGITTTDAVTLLVERSNHLEDLLVSSLFSFLLTGTFGAFAAIHTIRAERRASAVITPTQLLAGANVLLGFLSGYYYFMLAQYYATVVGLVPLARSVGDPFEDVWQVLRIPSFGILGASASNFALLLSAPLFPFLFSAFVIAAMWVLVRHGIDPPRQGAGHRNQRRGLGVYVLVGSILAQALLSFLLISQPFHDFIVALGVV